MGGRGSSRARDVRARGRDRDAGARGLPPGRAQAVGANAIPGTGGNAVKGVRAKDLRGNQPDELQRTMAKLENDLFQHRLKKSTNQLENTMLIRNTRRELARVHTVLAERLRQEKDGKPAQGATTAQPTAKEK